jgi:hypothetical protein
LQKYFKSLSSDSFFSNAHEETRVKSKLVSNLDCLGRDTQTVREQRRVEGLQRLTAADKTTANYVIKRSEHRTKAQRRPSPSATTTRVNATNIVCHQHVLAQKSE